MKVTCKIFGGATFGKQGGLKASGTPEGAKQDIKSED